MDFINGLKKERASLAKRLEAVDVLLASYDTNDTHTTNISNESNSDYPTKGSIMKQIAYVIKRENRFLHNSEITEALLPYVNKSRELLSRRISSVLTKAKGEVGNLVNIRVGKSIQNTFWGSKKWLDSNGDPLEAHMYDKSKVKMRRTKGINI